MTDQEKINEHKPPKLGKAKMAFGWLMVFLFICFMIFILMLLQLQEVQQFFTTAFGTFFFTLAAIFLGIWELIKWIFSHTWVQFLVGGVLVYMYINWIIKDACADALESYKGKEAIKDAVKEALEEMNTDDDYEDRFNP